jgi:hypothetical protein
MRSTIGNKRIGERTPVSLRARLQPMPRSSSFLKRNPKAQQVTITNISVSGAEVECRPFSLEIRDKARLEVPEGSAVVEIRRIEPVHRGRVRYGMQFLTIDPALVVVFNQLSAGLDTDEVDWRWSTAR